MGNGNNIRIGQFDFTSSVNPNITGNATFSNSIKNATQQASKLGTSGLTNTATNTAGGMSKLQSGLERANQFVTPAQAAIGVVGLGMDIYNTVQAQKLAKEQMELAKKNFNLELEKSQKQELANNELAASIDKAWGGSGKVAQTIDYSQYNAGSGGGSSLVSGGAGGHYMGSSANDSGSGNMPMASSASLSPVGYSDSIESENEEEGKE